MIIPTDVYKYGAAPPSGCHYEASVSSSSATSSPTSSVFSVATSSQTSKSSASSLHSDFGPLAPPTPGNEPIAPVTRVSTFPKYQPPASRDAARHLPPLRIDAALPAEQRHHPRRSSTLQGPPPQLVRQAERKVNFVDGLVDSATQMVEAIWPLSVRSNRCDSTSSSSSRGVLPLRTYIQETLRRSRTSYYTLQVALYYLIMIKSHVPKHDFTMEQAHDTASYRALQCGRRMFLAALILASKYLQDRNYSAQAWSKMSGLTVREINTNEMAFLEAVKWKLHITPPVWERWQEVIFRYTPSQCPPYSPGGACTPNTWKIVLPTLTPELENIVVPPKTPVSPVRPVLRASSSLYSLRNPSKPSLLFNSPCASNESTPTPGNWYPTPRVLEPSVEPIPQTPPHVRLSKLPTPALTPMSVTTPALSGLSASSRRPSMCFAMSQAQTSSLARSCVDQYNPAVRTGLEQYHFPSRRPSLAPSTTSSASSPESMVTDNSRSSRASSISSVSSAGFALNRPLARYATCRNLPTLSKCKERSESPLSHTSSPDLASFHIDDPEATPPVRVDSPQSVIGPADNKRRKRGISSPNADLQQNVQDLLKQPQSFGPTVFTDPFVAKPSVLPSSGMMGLCADAAGSMHSRSFTVADRPMPTQKEPRKKQKCCASEAIRRRVFNESRNREGIS